LSNEPFAMFCASRIEAGTRQGAYRLDYLIGSSSSPFFLWRGALLPTDSAVVECTAIGITAQGVEVWGQEEAEVECVGVPPYPGSGWPRVVGIVRPADTSPRNQVIGISYVHGDAIAPSTEGAAIIAHVVNDATPNWGGRGFAQALRERMPQVQDDFRQWSRLHRHLFKLGEGRHCRVSPTLSVFSMICQEGYGPSLTPRLRYGPLQSCLIRLAKLALEHKATVHMPRIGAGQAGGSWPIIEELIDQELCSKGVLVTVYDLIRVTSQSSSSR